MRTGAEGAADRASVSDGACRRCRAGPPRSLCRTRRPRDAAVDATSSPSARARCPKAEGREAPPLLPPPSAALHPPARHRPSALGILPAAPAARGACPPSRRHSGRRLWLDTDTNRAQEPIQAALRGGPGLHPQQAPARETLSGPSSSARAGPSTPILLVRLLKPPSFSALPGPQCLQNDPRRGDSNPASPTSESIGSQSLGLILPMPLLGPTVRI